MEDWFIPYVAGLLDGEGCITISKTPLYRNHLANYKLEVIIVNNCFEPLELCQKQFRGSLYARKQLLNRHTHFVWRLVADSAYKFLKIVSPYLIIKKEQAKLGMEFRKARTNCVPARGRHLSSEELNLRGAYYQRMKQLNHSP